MEIFKNNWKGNMEKVVSEGGAAQKNSLGWENGVPASAVLREISEAEDVRVAHS